MHRYLLFLNCLFLKMSITIANVEKDTSFTESQLVLKTKTGDIFGTLTIPQETKNIPVALIISGSGPTDRDGNNPYMKNDCLKELAHKLSEDNIASLRFDKGELPKVKMLAKTKLT